MELAAAADGIPHQKETLGFRITNKGSCRASQQLALHVETARKSMTPLVQVHNTFSRQVDFPDPHRLPTHIHIYPFT